jgi:hypothetical protein
MRVLIILCFSAMMFGAAYLSYYSAGASSEKEAAAESESFHSQRDASSQDAAEKAADEPQLPPTRPGDSLVAAQVTETFEQGIERRFHQHAPTHSCHMASLR